ncbi:MAG: pyruvate dehydrogenase complex dihydrolipoamide acetyltransferase [Hyphomicrobiales bacterium]|nr:MAG: pyruvate dehydrogenase complex dihydrolipoamide acetyltransferase [Hyphomicrobiales bacterium]
MPISILMPALSPTMETGKLAGWNVKEGEHVAPGDVIAEIETDKATMEVEAVEEGRLARILIEAGTEGVAVNTPIALLLEEGEDESALEGFDTQAPAAPAKDKPAEEKPAEDKPAEVKPTEAAAPAPAPAKPAEEAGARLFASPLARRMAAQNEIDLAQLQGSGPGGRIVKADIEAAMRTGAPKAAPAAASAPAAAAPAPAPMDPNRITALYEPGSFTEVALDNMRATIARRLTEAKRDVPHYYLSVDCQIDTLLGARKRLNERLEDGRISVNDFIIRAAALALIRVPDANAAFAGDRLLKFKHADISMAVAIEGGLITPIIRKADTKSLAEIAAESKQLAEKAKTRKLQPQEYEGGSFSVSNLGMFGIKNFTAVINPPQAAIMAVGAGEKRAVVAADGSLSAATMMTVTLSCDHRVIDGALGARLLAEFKTFIEDPVMMLA